jgi:hypothetical protein
MSPMNHHDPESAESTGTEQVPDVAGSSPGLLDATVGMAASIAGLAVSATRGAARAAIPLGHAVLHPPLVPEPLHPARAVDALSERGREALASAGGELQQVVAAIVPAVVREVLDSLDLNAIIRERVDIDALVSTVDIGEIVDRVDVDAIVSRVDIDAIADRIDISRIVARIDLNAIADRLDISRIIARVDVDGIVATVDLDAIVARLNVVGLAEDVINEIDLPEIIRDSTGSMASQVVRDARMQSIDADEAVSRVIDRILRRRRDRSTIGPAQPQPAPLDN